MPDITYDQYYPGGCFKQLSDAAGSAISYSQYALGGPANQLRMHINPALVLDQHSSGGVWKQAEVAVEGGGSSAPEWVPEGATAFADFVNAQYYADGAERALTDMVSNAVLDVGGLVFTGEGAPVLAVSYLLAALQLPFSAVFNQVWSDGNSFGGALTLRIDGVDSNHYGTVNGTNVALTTDDFDVVYLGAHNESPNTDSSGKIAFTMSNTKAAMSVNGETTITDTSQTLSFGSIMQAGIWSGLGVQVAAGHVRSITVYPPQGDVNLSVLSA